MKQSNLNKKANKTNNLTKILMAFTLFAILTAVFGSYMHERVHQTIFAEYGIDSEIGFDIKSLNFYTLGESPCPTETCSLAHLINESIGYNIQMIFVLMFSGFAFVILVKGLRIKDKEVKNGKRN